MKNCDLLLIRLAKCYFRGSLALTIELRDVDSMNWHWQQKFLDLTVNNELIKQYPVSNTFSKLFFKFLINYLSNQEIHDDLYAHLCMFMNNRPSTNCFSYRHYVIGTNLTEIISVKESNRIVMDGTTGLQTWEAALVLADWALCNKEAFTDKKVLELGSGVGFTGVTIAKLCHPQSMIMTDCHSKVMNTICDNIKMNFPNVDENEEDTLYRNKDQEIGAMILDWNAIENFPTSIIPDVIIASDIVYDPTLIQPLCDVLKTFFDRNKDLVVYIATVLRNEDTFQTFLDTVGGMNFNVEKVPLNGGVFIEWDQSIDKSLLRIKC